MMKRHFFAAAFIFAGAVSAGHGQTPDNAIKARQEIMSFVGAQMRPLAGMARGRVEFDADRVRLIGSALVPMAAALPNLFPAGSETGSNTEAAPSIFDDMDGFTVQSALFLDAARSLAGAANADQFAAAFGEFSGTCRSCHSKYRVD